MKKSKGKILRIVAIILTIIWLIEGVRIFWSGFSSVYESKKWSTKIAEEFNTPIEDFLEVGKLNKGHKTEALGGTLILFSLYLGLPMLVYAQIVENSAETKDYIDRTNELTKELLDKDT